MWEVETSISLVSFFKFRYVFQCMFVKYKYLCSEFRSEYEGSTYRSDLGKIWSRPLTVLRNPGNPWFSLGCLGKSSPKLWPNVFQLSELSSFTRTIILQLGWWNYSPNIRTNMRQSVSTTEWLRIALTTCDFAAYQATQVRHQQLLGPQLLRSIHLRSARRTPWPRCLDRS